MLNQLKTGAALTYISLGLGYIISIVYTPVMLRLLGQSEYGLYNLVASVVSYLGLFNFGFGSAYIRYYSYYKAEDNCKDIANLNGMFLIIFSIIGFIAIVAGTVLIINIDLVLGHQLTRQEITTASILMTIMTFNIAISFPNVVFNSNIIANENFVFQKTIELIRTVVNPFLILPVLFLGYGSIGMVVATTSLNVAIQITNIIFCFKKLNMKFSFQQFDISLMKEITIFSSYLFINMIIDQINWNVDKFILGRFHGTVAVALYGLGALINTYYLSLSVAISNVFIPRVNRMVVTKNDNKDLTELFIRVGRIQFIILSLISSGFIFFGQPFISMWAGNDYKDTYFITLLLIIPVTIPLIQNIGIEIQKAKNIHQFRTWVYLFIAVANILISIPMVKSHEGIGAALGTAISLIIGNVIIMNWYYHKKVGLNMREFWGQIIRIVPALFPPIFIGILMILFIDIDNFKMFLLLGLIYIIVFSIFMWFFGMNQYEKNLIRKPARKVFNRFGIFR
ncbi:MAG: oligosaccharide flippase family protein [Clostridia bacterium]|nr:oligosaccharide flippase family protein [Clostridia bacterium]